MARVYVFGDEGGDLTFERKSGASRYFMIGTATMPDCTVGDELLTLRRELAWQGLQLEMFHAANDKQRVRDRVFAVIARHNIRVDATILDKPKTIPRLQAVSASVLQRGLVPTFQVYRAANMSPAR
jgi:hypothetical protein